jgi:hypothetical protein
MLILGAMKQASDLFTIGIILKPYVKRYLINNFGDPVNLYCHKGNKLKKLMTDYLERKDKTHDKRINYDDCNETRFVISKCDFYRYGWEMSKSNMLKFNSNVEAELKFICRMWIMNDRALGVPLKKSIEDFQLNFGFSDQEFSYDTIRKDYQRNCEFPDFRNTQRIKEIRNLFLQQVSLAGTR